MPVKGSPASVYGFPIGQPVIDSLDGTDFRKSVFREILIGAVLMEIDKCLVEMPKFRFLNW